ncbi:hypothetical protein [Vibrio europaeus]|uniref:hypothetical protein n=1 Tax=Vibrio europaeus TaxID=300876 RepID=UPI00233E7DF4|nr:hypothetical protein [Vibrio europaeus]MDC5711153.1 hypothetical protein [Vibrio europaeus]MDC5713182.1 hypothetical protein [Vibrio europaeus]
MTSLGMSKNDGLASYEVSYRQTSSANTRPVGIQVSVSLLDRQEESAITRFLAPDEIRTPRLIFNAPLNYQLPDWQQLNTSTGCIK